MSKCEQFKNTGSCYPGIDNVKAVRHTEHLSQGPEDTIPYSWVLTARDSNFEKEDEYWVCEDCHIALLMKKLAAGDMDE